MSSYVSELLSGGWVYGVVVVLGFFSFFSGDGNGQRIQAYLIHEDTIQSKVLLVFQSL